MTNAIRYHWSALNTLQKGMYGEYFAKMEFAMFGFLVFSSEADDRGIDFVVRRSDGKHFDVQVKTITGTNYTFVKESKFDKDLVVCLIVLNEGNPPSSYLFVRDDWNTPSNRELLKLKKFDNASEAEYGFYLAQKREALLSKFEISARINLLSV